MRLQEIEARNGFDRIRNLLCQQTCRSQLNYCFLNPPPSSNGVIPNIVKLTTADTTAASVPDKITESGIGIGMTPTVAPADVAAATML